MKEYKSFVKPKYQSKYYIMQQHVMRYVFAAKFVENKYVLDAACGVGYGSSYLTRKGAKEVVGFDLSTEAIKNAKNHYNRSQLHLLIGDVTYIPLLKNCLNVVISFETIEHINNYEKFLKEIVRILKIDGTCVISTPNIKYTFHPYYHVKEFEADEFFQLLRKNFIEIYQFGQYLNIKDRFLEVFNYNVLKIKLIIKNIKRKFLLLIKKNIFPNTYIFLKQLRNNILNKITLEKKYTCRKHKTYEITNHEEISYINQSVLRFNFKKCKILRIMVAVCKLPKKKDKWE
ncbi:MAG: class I SAM-dependent methyltransferase [Candidatus Hodarchaeota archaeon]